MYREIVVSGICYTDLNTEIRFEIANSRSEGTELLRLVMAKCNADSRIENCITRVLRAMMRSGLIQFYVPESKISSGTTESEFLINKYGDLLQAATPCGASFYVKL